MKRTPKLVITFAAAVCVMLGLAAYVYLQSREYLRGPVILIEEPTNGSAFLVPLVAVRGTAENVSFLTLNGRQIFTDERGQFRESLLLHDGYNIMTLEAKDRFGHRTEKRLELVYAPQPAASSSPPAERHS